MYTDKLYAFYIGLKFKLFKLRNIDMFEKPSWSDPNLIFEIHHTKEEIIDSSRITRHMDSIPLVLQRSDLFFVKVFPSKGFILHTILLSSSNLIRRSDLIQGFQSFSLSCSCWNQWWRKIPSDRVGGLKIFERAAHHIFFFEKSRNIKLCARADFYSCYLIEDLYIQSMITENVEKNYLIIEALLTSLSIPQK